MRAPEALRCCSQAAISDWSWSKLSMRRSRHWPRRTLISISIMLSQLACLVRDVVELQAAQHAARFMGGEGLIERSGRVGRQIVEDDADTVCFRAVNVSEFAHAGSEVDGGPA